MLQKNNTTNTLLTIIIVVLIILLGGAGYFYFAKERINPDANYHAVFLDNGQVYFGKLKSQDEKQISLTDVYYLQAKDIASDSATQGNLALIKLGSELHNPKDQVYINYQHVLYTQNLEGDSKIIQAIQGYKKK